MRTCGQGYNEQDSCAKITPGDLPATLIQNNENCFAATQKSGLQSTVQHDVFPILRVTEEELPDDNSLG